MKKTNKTDRNLYKRLGMWAMVVGALLLLPLLSGAPWTLGDFIFAGVILFGAATVYEVVTQHMKDRTHRIMTAVGVLMGVVAIWAWAVN